MNLDPILFDQSLQWSDRCNNWISARPGNSFLEANQSAVREILAGQELQPRVVVNIGADALIKFLKEGVYKNAYERPVLMGKPVGASTQRQKVDKLLGFPDPKLLYFGAVALGGTGVRFYGEYCIVLRADLSQPTLSIFDRNSYDLVKAPLAGIIGIVNALKGQWQNDLLPMLVLKVLPKLGDESRLVTGGTVSQAVLADEDFVEVHRQTNFKPIDVEEVRVAPEEATLESDIRSRHERGQCPSATELLYASRRAHSCRALNASRVKMRLVVSAGRTARRS